MKARQMAVPLEWGEWRWYCMDCHSDLGPMVGKHKQKCGCGSKSAYCTPRGPKQKVRLR